MIYIYDIECVINCATFCFIDANTPQNLIDDYINADINKNDAQLKLTLDKLNFKEFIIYEDINQLTSLVQFLRNKNTATLVSYNGHRYDDIILDYILNNSSILATYSTDKLIHTLKDVSDEIIAVQNIGNPRKELKIKYSGIYTSIDLMRLHALDKSKTSLKQVAIRLKWYRVEDYTPPPVTDAEIMKYGYDGKVEWFNRYVLPEHLSALLFYNRNDVLSTYKLYIYSKDELVNRIHIQTKYKVNVVSLSRSSTADVLMSKFYADATGLSYWDFRDKRTYRRKIKFSNIIADDIHFKTDKFKSFLNHLKKIVINIGVNAFEEMLIFNNTAYNFAQGGLHSEDRPEMLISTDDYTYIDADVNSFYPNIIIKYKFTPKHLITNAFIDILTHITTERLMAKHSGDKITADILKIVINSVYGKLGFEYGFLYDLLCLYQVTINGQLNLLMLIEELELNGIHVVSANTDGIVAKVYKNKEDEYYNICANWEHNTKFKLDYTKYTKYIRLNVNSYISIKDDGSVKVKKDFSSKLTVNKGYNSPVIAKVLYEYYVNDNRDIDTLIRSFEIYDYCIAIKVGRQFITEYHTLKNGAENIEVLQKDNRYFVSNSGGVLLKRKIETGKLTNVIKGKYVTIFNTYYKSDNYNINYDYYKGKVMEIINRINGINTKEMRKNTGSLFDNLE